MPILVVEDDEPVRDLLCEALGEKYDCTAVATAEAALALLARRRFDVVLTDLNLPGVDGFELTKVVSERHPLTRVIVITGEPLDAQLWWSALGLFAYLTKPLDLEEVERLVGLAVEAGRSGR